jgi:ATP-binding cassette subfamily B protein
METTTTAPLASYRYAWRMFRFRPKRQLINLAGVFYGWLGNLLPGIGAKIVFDRLAEGRVAGSLGWLVWPIVLVLVRGTVGLVTVPSLQLTNGAFAYANAARLQRNLLRRILELPGGRSLPASPGEAISRFRDDTEAVVWYPIMFNNVIGSAITGGVALAVMASINPLITVAVFVPLVIVILLVESARARIVQYRHANQVRTSEVTGFIADVFTAAQSVQVANAEGRVVERFRELNANRRKAAVNDRLLDEVLRGAFWVVNVGTAIVLVFAGRSLQSGDFTVGDLALFVFYLTIFEAFVRDMGAGLAGYRQLGVSFGRMHELLQGAPAEVLIDADEIHERGPLPSPRPAPLTVEPLEELRVEGLSYEGRITDVSLVLRRGTFTVITGRVGSGKSTLLHALLGLVPADGRIWWNGSLVEDPATFLVPPRIAYTPQVPNLFTGTIEDNIALGWDGDVAAAVELAVLGEDLAEMPEHLATGIGSRGVRLSGGQLQRTAAARMFVRTPELLVCDDLSSALDVETEAALWERVFAEAGRRTVLAVSHRPAVLARADQVIRLDAGSVSS